MNQMTSAQKRGLMLMWKVCSKLHQPQPRVQGFFFPHSSV